MIQPLISIRILNPHRQLEPGDMLRGEYQVDGVEARELQAVEASVLWHSEGKGDEDLGVHFFERRVRADAPDGDLRALRQLAVKLPQSPLSYQGVTLKIRWCLRVRVFVRRGREAFFEQSFRLGRIPPVRPLAGSPAPDSHRVHDPAG